MRLARNLFAIALAAAAPAFAADVSMQGHTLRVFVENQQPDWVAQDDVASAERLNDNSGREVLRIHLKPDAAQRMKSLTAGNVGKKVRFMWDGKVVSDLTIRGSFGERFDLPAPPD